MEQDKFKEVINDIQIPQEMKQRLIKRCIEEEQTSHKVIFPIHFGGKRKFSIILATILLFVAISVSAVTLLRWNKEVAKDLEPTEVQEEELIKKDVTRVYDTENGNIISATNNDITIKVLQTIQDKNNVYVYLEISASDMITLPKECGFEFSTPILPKNDEKYAFTSVNSTFMPISLEDPSNIRYYKMCMRKNPNYDFTGKIMNISFKNLQHDMGKLKFKTVVEGTWNLKINMDFQDSTQHFDINKVYNLSGYDVMVKSIDISPISYTITYSGNDIRKVEKGEGANLNHLDTLEPICLHGVKYKSGETQEVFSTGGESGFDENEENYTESLCFDKIIDVDNLQSLLFGEQLSEVSLH